VFFSFAWPKGQDFVQDTRRLLKGQQGQMNRIRLAVLILLPIALYKGMYEYHYLFGPVPGRGGTHFLGLAFHSMLVLSALLVFFYSNAARRFTLLLIFVYLAWHYFIYFVPLVGIAEDNEPFYDGAGRQAIINDIIRAVLFVSAFILLAGKKAKMLCKTKGGAKL
jgi:hypothetical protein